MLGTRRGKLIYICTALFLTAVMAAVQGIADAAEVSDEDGGEVIADLLPAETAPEAAHVAAEIADLLPDEVKEVTADIDISDMLLPPEETEETKNVEFSLKKAPVVLIYHTHTTEAYRQTETYTYEPSGSFRTHETDKNITGIGEALSEELTKLGCTVLHDVTDHEPPKLSTSYERSIVTMQKYLEEHPEIDICIDVHRDASGIKNTEDVVEIDGVRCARLMFVVGKGSKYDDKPDFDMTYGLASALTDELESICRGFTREVRVKSGRYNQHLRDMSLLVEVGHNANTYDEAKASMPYLARAIYTLTAPKD